MYILYIKRDLCIFREKDLERFFKGYGRKTDVLIKQVKTASPLAVTATTDPNFYSISPSTSCGPQRLHHHHHSPLPSSLNITITTSITIITIILKGFGFVEFEDHRDADDAVYELNGKDLMGERWGQYSWNFSTSSSARVSVEHSRGTRRDRSSGRGR